MLTPISINTPSPVRGASPTHKLCASAESKKLDVELAAKVKAMKDSAKARKESKGPILKRKMACATCRRRKASAEAAGHPSAVPPGPCVYDCDQTEEPVPNRFFANGSFHSLTFHSHPRMPLTPGFGMPSPFDATADSLNYLPPTSPHGVWAYGDFPMTPSRVPVCNSTSCNTTPMMTTPTRPPMLSSTPMRRIISPSLAINSTPVQEHDVFYSPPSQEQWTPYSAMSTDSTYYSPMVHSMSEGLSSISSAASTPSLAATRSIRSPFPMVQDLGTPLSMPPSTPCSETFDVNCLGPPIMPRTMLSPHEQQLKCTSFLQSLEPMPSYNLLDFSAAAHTVPMMPCDSVEIVAGNDLGLINGPMDGKLDDPFNSVPVTIDEASLMSMTLGSTLTTDLFSTAMPNAGWTC
ncbi:hypothetical protein BCV70DRAFT_219449 [Testicularia cyperi]|uniref:Uncharacterized protein n=1 Tax=Testicularia cyperi TaxID=1882483 RepID=A0A317XGS9_9BASI|nr:hypothetical protein BCV70DRAFT_219449 [Testicularia cyperi]